MWKREARKGDDPLERSGTWPQFHFSSKDVNGQCLNTHIFVGNGPHAWKILWAPRSDTQNVAKRRRTQCLETFSNVPAMCVGEIMRCFHIITFVFDILCTTVLTYFAMTYFTKIKHYKFMKLIQITDHSNPIFTPYAANLRMVRLCLQWNVYYRMMTLTRPERLKQKWVQLRFCTPQSWNTPDLNAFHPGPLARVDLWNRSLVSWQGQTQTRKLFHFLLKMSIKPSLKQIRLVTYAWQKQALAYFPSPFLIHQKIALHFGLSTNAFLGFTLLHLVTRRAILQMKRAHRIACVGGGLTGVELAGEIKTDYPDKQVCTTGQL